MSIQKIYAAKKVDATTNEILTAYLEKCTKEGAIREGGSLPEIDFESKDVKGYVARKHCINLSYAGATIASLKEPLKLGDSLAPNGKPIYVALYRWSGLQGLTKPTNEEFDPNRFDFNLMFRGIKPFLNFVKGIVDFLVKTWDEFLNLLGIGATPNDKDPITQAYVSESDLDKKIVEIPKVHKPKKASEKLPEDPVTFTSMQQLTDTFSPAPNSGKQDGMVILFYSKSEKWLQLTEEDGIASNMQNYNPYANGSIPAITEFPGDVTHIFIKWVNSSETKNNEGGYTDESGGLYGKVTFYDKV